VCRRLGHRAAPQQAGEHVPWPALLIWMRAPASLLSRPGKSNKEAAQTREAIVAAAADYIRRTGIAEAGLADVMAAVGLTHGGFYRHFRNKEHLVAEAPSAAGAKTIATIDQNLANGGVNAAVQACQLHDLDSEIPMEAPTSYQDIMALRRLIVFVLSCHSGQEDRQSIIQTMRYFIDLRIVKLRKKC
jgi:AcrR family transcriptional regulator